MWRHVELRDRVRHFLPRRARTVSLVPSLSAQLAERARQEYHHQQDLALLGAGVGPSFPDVDDDDDVDYLEIGHRLQGYLDRVLGGWFCYNEEGRHVLHELSEDYRKRESQFSMPLFL
jgi:hypothetical protein